jgi:hypothetical protein
MLITSLPDDIINKTVLEFADTPIGCSAFFPRQTTYVARSLIFSHLAWLFELAGGAIGDFENSCLPKEQREATFNVAALHQWDLGIDDPKCVYTAENVSDPPALRSRPKFDPNRSQWLDKTLKPVAQGGPFPSVCAPFSLHPR